MCRHNPDWMRCLSLIQRSLLLSDTPYLSQPTSNASQCQQTVVFVVTDGNAPATVLSSLHLCAELLAPCTHAGLSELRHRFSEQAPGNGTQGLRDPTIHSSETPGACKVGDTVNVAKRQRNLRHKSLGPSCESSCESSRKDAQAGKYGLAARPGHKPDEQHVPQPWKTLLQCPTLASSGVVLQAITPAMLADVTVCAPRATAFSVHSKLCACAQGSAALQQKAVSCPTVQQGQAPAVTVQSVAPAFKLSQTPLPQLHLEGFAATQHSRDGAHAPFGRHSSGGKELNQCSRERGEISQENGESNSGYEFSDDRLGPRQKPTADSSQRRPPQRWPRSAYGEATERSTTGWQGGTQKGGEEMEEGESWQDDLGEWMVPYGEEAWSPSYWHKDSIGCASLL
jgi:hypothetical protein